MRAQPNGKIAQVTPNVHVDRDDPLESRRPKQLLFAVLAEQIVMGVHAPLLASTYVSILSGAGIKPATTRAKLDRLVVEGYLVRIRDGGGIRYELTPTGFETLRTVQNRMDHPDPFEPRGSGWTLVTFTVPEQQRGVRQRLRAALTWEGFVPVRDGLWVAPGEADLDEVLDPMHAELVNANLVAFHAHDLPKYSLTPIAPTAWNLDGALEAHLRFADLWGDAVVVGTAAPLPALMLLAADWYALLRADPRLPTELLDDEWPSANSTRIYRARRNQLVTAAHEAFHAAINR